MREKSKSRPAFERFSQTGRKPGSTMRLKKRSHVVDGLRGETSIAERSQGECIAEGLVLLVVEGLSGGW